MNLEHARESYGDEVVEHLTNRIKQTKEENHGDFKIEIISEIGSETIITFSTKYYTWFYAINTYRKELESRFVLSNWDIASLLKIVESIKA